MADACDLSSRPPAPDTNPADDEIAAILRSTKRIAVVGLSNKPDRASYDVGRYLLGAGYGIVPVHPNIAVWEGIPAVKRLADVTGPVDLVDLFLNADRVADVVDEIVAAAPKVAWLQLGVVNNEAAVRLRAAGIVVVQDRCVKIEHRRLLTP